MYYRHISDTVGKIFNASISGDIANDISIKLLLIENDKLNQLHKDGAMKRYIYRTAINEKMDFHRREATASVIDYTIINYESPDHLKVEDVMGCLDEYELKLISVYCESKSLVQMCKKYGFRRATIADELKKIKEKIKSNIEIV